MIKNEILLICVISAISAFTTSFIIITGLRRWLGNRLLDIPNVRSSHFYPIPRGGGIAIVIVTLAGSWLILPFVRSDVTAWQWLVFTIGALLIAGVSWLDDLRSLSTRVRFAVHLAGAVLAVLAFGAWKEITLPGLGNVNLGLLGWPLTLVWIVGLTNAYNFMDGIDGIAGGLAVVAGLGWVIMGIIGSNPLLCIVGILLFASSAGFLGHNWPPAKMFMGDVGSAFLGYTFAVLPVIAARGDARFMLVGILLVWPFVFDTVFTFLRRLRKRENVFTAHRSHLYQRLVISGLSHQTVALLYVALALIGVVLAAAYVLDWRHIGIAALVMLIIAAIGLCFLTVRRARMC